MADPARPNRILLLGHRGARAVKSIPENTLASFDQALADGCDGFELDVRLTADGEAVVCHDAEFSGIEIASASAKQLPRLPRLEEVVARYGDRAFLDIELKVSGLEKKASHVLRNKPPQRGYVISSFLPEVLLAVRAGQTGIPLGLICETRAQLRRWRELPVGYVIPHHNLLDQSLISRLKAAEKKILVWTVNDPADMRRFRDLGVDGIISDQTRLLCKTLSTGRDSA